MIMLSAPPLIIGIVIHLITGYPKGMIQANLLKRGLTYAATKHAVCEAEMKIKDMLKWGSVPNNSYSLDGDMF